MREHWPKVWCGKRTELHVVDAGSIAFVGWAAGGLLRDREEGGQG